MTKLNKFIAESGICSRRNATDLIKSEQVTVNGAIVREPFYEVLPTDAVKVRNKLILHQERKLYFLFNKPEDVITTSSDPEDRTTIMHFFKRVKERVYPVGRLDRNTTGLIVVTNDGDLAQKLSHPKFNVSKTYYVTTHKPVTLAHQQSLLTGVKLEDGIAKVDKINTRTRKKNTIAVTIHSGKKHIVKRIFTKLRYFVEKLDRVKFATLTKQGLPLGAYRALSQEEVDDLKNL